ncbi:glycosyltransferase family 9 protein [Paenarthrobacter sp. PH39-S1]|uniref:glycosyltransferase family 9 protein n=1 Tax=Paenarthrobacter sp. PH39-S1 TaxID=3046204 RepID=UPI0024BBAB97|nr:glycosyltransferase family 9 protein [Paenarthrobacter sp. PH39-S1]MDJ0355350.1 glycosyltransferase family 9 protein [Paenarthrobacter sp. PH39-S1]
MLTKGERVDHEPIADFGGGAVRGTGVGPLLQRFPDVRRIAVLRGGGLGDLMFALPALQALAACYPEAQLVLLGTPVHATLLGETHSPVHRVEVLPYAEGVRPGPEDPLAQAGFFARMRAENFDLAVQLHGGGRYSNPFLLGLGARHTVGMRTPDAVRLERTIPYIYYQHEQSRSLEVAGLAGAASVDLETRLHPREEARRTIWDLLQGSAQSRSPLLTIHPGATDARRRWPVESFARVAAAAAAAGSRVFVVGDEADKALADDVVGLAAGDGGAVRSLAGRLSLGELTALLVASDVMLGNDSGPRHLAQAVGTPTVGIYWVGNAINAGALGRTLHRLHLSWVTNCRVCGVDVTQVGWTAERCAHDESLVSPIRPEAVYGDVRDLTATSLLLRDRSASRALRSRSVGTAQTEWPVPPVPGH